MRGLFGRTILIAEDMDDNYLLYKIYLEKHYDLIRATNGEEAVSKYLECNPDIILMDIACPWWTVIRQRMPFANCLPISPLWR